MDRYTRFRGGSDIWSNTSTSSMLINKDFFGSQNYFWIKISGVWKKCITWIKVSGVWRQATPKIKVTGIWK